MSWNKVGSWLKDNAGTGVTLIGSLLTGNVPGAIAAGSALVSTATGETDPAKVLQRLQSDPATVVKLRELEIQEEASIRQHLETMRRMELEDEQHQHEQTQQTVREGDKASDTYIRHTRPTMAKQSWTATIAYCIGCFGVQAITGDNLFAITIAGILSAPAWAYLGLRTGDKAAEAWKMRKS